MNMVRDQIYLRARGATAERDEDAFDKTRNNWPGLSAERVRISKLQELAFRFQGHAHYLALHDIVRTDGETTIDGFARSVRRDIRDAMTFVPAGASVEGWSKFTDRRSSLLTIFLDPNAADVELRAEDLPPRLHFENPSLKQSVQKIDAAMKTPFAQEQTYVEHLGLILLCELRAALLGKPQASALKGGLTPQQLNRVCEYITANLCKNISVSELAGLIHLSRFHFVRAFKKTTGKPPYHFVLSTRVERAKELLTESNFSVGAVARSVGFHGTLQLDRAFHRLIGATPSSYRRQADDNESKFRVTKPANASDLKPHPGSLGSLRDIWCETPHHADETDECSDDAGTTFDDSGRDCG